MQGVKQRQSYKRVAKQYICDAYFGHHPKRKKKATMGKKFELLEKSCSRIRKKIARASSKTIRN